MEHYDADVDDKAKVISGQQHTATVDGYMFPILIKNSVPFREQELYCDFKHQTLTHVIMTSSAIWDPKVAESAFEESHGNTNEPYVATQLPQGKI